MDVYSSSFPFSFRHLWSPLLSVSLWRVLRAPTRAHVPRAMRACTVSTARWPVLTPPASMVVNAGRDITATATCACVPADTLDSTVRKEWTSARCFPVLMVKPSCHAAASQSFPNFPNTPLFKFLQLEVVWNNRNCWEPRVYCLPCKQSAAQCKCHHCLSQLLMKAHTYPSVVHIMSCCKHGGLWDCSVAWEQYLVLRSHCSLWRSTNSDALIGGCTRRCTYSFWKGLLAKCSLLSKPVLDDCLCRWCVSAPGWHEYVQLPCRIHRPALWDQY